MSPKPSGFKGSVTITHIGTATAIIDIDGVRFITDPAFDPAGSEYPVQPGVTLKNEVGPAIDLHELPHIDAVLLSHEDHPDNLDTRGRQLLEGRKVYTTDSGAKSLEPRPDIYGFSDWQSRDITAGGKHFRLTATPCKHLPGGDCVGFILEAPDTFGVNEKTGLPNAIWFGGDTVLTEELKTIKDKWHVMVAILNLGDAHASPELQITMSGREGAALCEELDVDVMTPIHFDGWGHFAEQGPQLRDALKGVPYEKRIRFLELGKAISVI